MHLAFMITRSESAARWSFSGGVALCLALAAVISASALAQSPTAVPESSAARNLPAPAPPSVSTGPTLTTTSSVNAPARSALSANDPPAVEVFGDEDLRTNGRLNAAGTLPL